MRLGDTKATYDIEVISSGSLTLDLALGIGGFSQRTDHRDFSALNPQVKRRLHYMRLRNVKPPVALRLLSMPNMLWIPSMPASWV